MSYAWATILKQITDQIQESIIDNPYLTDEAKYELLNEYHRYTIVRAKSVADEMKKAVDNFKRFKPVLFIQQQ